MLRLLFLPRGKRCFLPRWSSVSLYLGTKLSLPLISITSALLSLIAYETSFFYEGALIGCVMWLYIWQHAASYKQLLAVLCWWVLIVYGVHFTWLAQLIVSHTSYGLMGALVGWCVAVSYFFLLTAACWTFAWWARRSRVFWVGAIIVFFLLIEHRSMWFLSSGQGYPFFNPLLPLFQRSYAKYIFPIEKNSENLDQIIDSMCYIRPIANKKHNTDVWWRKDPQHYAYHLTHAIQSASTEESSLIVAPETSYPFILSNKPYAQQAIGISSSRPILLGTVIQTGDLLNQAVVVLHQRRIINFYVKKLLTPLFETVPVWAKRWGCDSCTHFDSIQPDGAVDVFQIEQSYLVPRICLEFFLMPAQSYGTYSRGSSCIVAFVNDSWFSPRFTKQLKRIAVQKAHLTGLPVVYVGHDDFFVVK